MHNATTKQRIAALRRRLGIFSGWQPRWVKERNRRLALLGVSQRGEPLALAAASWGARDVGSAPGRESPRPSFAPAALAAAGADATELDAAPPRDAAPTETLVAPQRDADATELDPAPRGGAAAAETVAFPPRDADTTELAGPTEGERTPARLATSGIGPAAPHPAAFAASPPRSAITVAPASRRSRSPARWLAAALALAAVVAGILALARREPAPPATQAQAAVAPAPLESAPAGETAIAAAAAVPSPPREPARAAVASRVEVRPGDTLWHLAATHLGDPLRWPELHAANAGEIRDPDLIFPGQQLQLPRVAVL